jgi:hypothetical protein
VSRSQRTRYEGQIKILEADKVQKRVLFPKMKSGLAFIKITYLIKIIKPRLELMMRYKIKRVVSDTACNSGFQDSKISIIVIWMKEIVVIDDDEECMR